MRIPFFKFECSNLEVKQVTEVLKSGWLTTAGKASEFERKFKERCNVSHALAVNSCTAGLHLALEAIGIGPGDKVIVPSLTFTASAEVIRYLGADPVFVDIEAGTNLITKEIIEAAIKSEENVKACVIVHFGGQSAELFGQNGIVSYCESLNIKTIIDAAHAFPAFDDYGPVGSVGDVTCFSFYANKTMTTGEGGMVVTNSSEISERIKVMRLHGINRDIWDRFTKAGASWEYDVVAPGYKYNMPDVNAAIGLAQLERVDEFRNERQRCAEKYFELLGNIDKLNLPKSRVSNESHSWHLFSVSLTENAKVERDNLIELLNEAGIGTSVHYKPLHQMTYYRNRYQLDAENFPNTEAYWHGCFSLPIYPSLKNSEIDYICEKLISFL